GEDPTSFADETGGKNGEVPMVRADVRKDSARMKMTSQVFGRQRLVRNISKIQRRGREFSHVHEQRHLADHHPPERRARLSEQLRVPSGNASIEAAGRPPMPQV